MEETDTRYRLLPVYNRVDGKAVEAWERYNYARQHGIRCGFFMWVRLGHSPFIKGYATHCTIGPRGGRYIHIVCDTHRLIKRRFKDVRFFADEPELFGLTG